MTLWYLGLGTQVGKIRSHIWRGGETCMQNRKWWRRLGEASSGVGASWAENQRLTGGKPKALEKMIKEGVGNEKTAESIKWKKGATGRKTLATECFTAYIMSKWDIRWHMRCHQGSLNASYDFWHPGYQINQMSRMQVWFFADVPAVHVSVSWHGLTSLGPTLATWVRVSWHDRRGVKPSSPDKSGWVYTCVHKPLLLVASHGVRPHMEQHTSWFLCNCANRQWRPNTWRERYKEVSLAHQGVRTSNRHEILLV